MVDTPYIRVEESGELVPLADEVTTVGRGEAVHVRLEDPSVSLLHAEIFRRGPYAYIVDLGLSHNGTRVNGRPVARRVLEDGDVVAFGAARCRVGGLARGGIPNAPEPPRPPRQPAHKRPLLRLYKSSRISGGLNRRIRLANEVVALGLVRPAEQPGVAGYIPEARTPL